MAVDVRPDQDLTTSELIANTTEAQKFLARSFRRRDDEPLAGTQTFTDDMKARPSVSANDLTANQPLVRAHQVDLVAMQCSARHDD